MSFQLRISESKIDIDLKFGDNESQGHIILVDNRSKIY